MVKPVSTPWIEMPINDDEPLIMHVDMNACFASMEQQANRMLRGRPVGVAAYAHKYGCVISPSYEAKAQGVKTGMRVYQAQELCPDIVIIQSHPTLYRDAHLRFKRIFESYTDKVTPKSIDEAVIDFRGAETYHHKSLESIGYEIKQRVHDEIGEWVRVNVGISTNRFLAKTAAGLHKPDGLDIITSTNVLDIYAGMTDLTDITGINTRNRLRLQLANINTPLEFFAAPVWKLRKQVFQSITGYYWYLKLRGWEVEDYVSTRKSIGHTYTLQDRTNNPLMLSKFMMKLCEKTGRRLRRNQLMAEAVHVWIQYTDGDFWHHGRKTYARLYTTAQIYTHAMSIFASRPYTKVIGKMGITVYQLVPFTPEQLGFFDGDHGDMKALSNALDTINDRYGDMVVGSGLLANMGDFVLDRISFGGVKDLQDLYEVEGE